MAGCYPDAAVGVLKKMNTHEQLIYEYFHIRGHIVEVNHKVGRRRDIEGATSGGWAGELDVVAWHPVTGYLIHLEPSIDANPWPKREERYRRKFASGRNYLRDIPQFAHFTDEQVGGLQQVAVLSNTPKGQPDRTPWIDGSEIWTLDSFMEEVKEYVHANYGTYWNGAISESYPFLRLMQMALNGTYRKPKSN